MGYNSSNASERERTVANGGERFQLVLANSQRKRVLQVEVVIVPLLHESPLLLDTGVDPGLTVLGHRERVAIPRELRPFRLGDRRGGRDLVPQVRELDSGNRH